MMSKPSKKKEVAFPLKPEEISGKYKKEYGINKERRNISENSELSKLLKKREPNARIKEERNKPPTREIDNTSENTSSDFTQSAAKQGGQKGKRMPRGVKTIPKQYGLTVDNAEALEAVAAQKGKSTGLYLNELLSENADIKAYLANKLSVPKSDLE